MRYPKTFWTIAILSAVASLTAYTEPRAAVLMSTVAQADQHPLPMPNPEPPAKDEVADLLRVIVQQQKLTNEMLLKIYAVELQTFQQHGWVLEARPAAPETEQSK